MEIVDLFEIIGIFITGILSYLNYNYMKRRDKKSDYISEVTDYRLKWIDLARPAISEYLFSVDKLSRGEDSTLQADYAFFCEKHWQMQSFLTTFSEAEEDARKLLANVYETATNLINPNCNMRQEIRDHLRRQLADGDFVLRRLMDENWFDVKDEITKGQKKIRMTPRIPTRDERQSVAKSLEDSVVIDPSDFSTAEPAKEEKVLERV